MPPLRRDRKLQDAYDAKLCPAGGWTIVGTTNANRLRKLFGASDPGMLLELIVEVIRFKFRMFRPGQRKQQDPLQILQSLTVSAKYSVRTEDHYRLNVVLRGKGKKCTVVPYVGDEEPLSRTAAQDSAVVGGSSEKASC